MPLLGRLTEQEQVLCGKWDDQSYRAARCNDAEFQERYGRFGIDRVWRYATKARSQASGTFLNVHAGPR